MAHLIEEVDISDGNHCLFNVLQTKGNKGLIKNLGGVHKTSCNILMVILQSSYNDLMINLQSSYDHLTSILCSTYNGIMITLQSFYEQLTMIL
jgi:hypothetical protein